MRDILVVKPSSLGDIVHGLLIAESIRRQLPDTRISWVVRDLFAPIVEACPTVNGDRLIFHRSAGLRGLFSIMKEIRQRRYDVVLDMQGLARSGMMTFAARSPRKLGRRDAREGASLACNEIIALPATAPDCHAVEILAELLPTLDLEKTIPEALTFTAPENAVALAELAKSRPILLFPDSRRPEKEWPHFAELTLRLLNSLENRTIAWAGTSDFPAPEEALQSSHFHDLRGRTTLGELPALIASAGSVVCNDSGPMHIAAAVGVPVVALFGPTDPRRYGPYPLDSPRHHVLSAPVGRLPDLSPATVEQQICNLLT